eukprot:NODE_701_length_4619_cov_0.487168.p1 type:complete len:885 gc:universal NODE_701_length_4619_cov_0.487168:1489-4143(+)
MYALFLILCSISIDCPMIIQLALDMDIKYTVTPYFMQYEQDCCLGVGIICENDRVVEIHWGFTTNYIKATYPLLIFPPYLRVLDLYNSFKSMIINELPETLEILDLKDVYDLDLQVTTFPNLKYIRLGYELALKHPKLPNLPDSIEYADISYFTSDILPRHPTNLRELHSPNCYNPHPHPFPNLPNTIEILDLNNCNLFGPISLNFTHIQSLKLTANHLNGNLSILSPNITILQVNENNFNRLIVKQPQELVSCLSSGNYFEPDNEIQLQSLQLYGCTYQLKNAVPSSGCPNLMQFLIQLNMHQSSPDIFSQLSNISNCCEYSDSIIRCVGNRIVDLKLSALNLNGTINTVLLPNTLKSLDISSNSIDGPFPNMTRLESLVFLNLRYNQIYGPIFNKLPVSLTILNVQSNILNGTISNLPNLLQLYAANNLFDGLENEFIGNKLTNIDISYNKIKGNIDMSTFIVTQNQILNFKSNYFDKIIFYKKVRNCDVSMNNIPQNLMTNITGCIRNYQRYDISKSDSCQYVVRMFRKMGISNQKIEENCCDVQGLVTCDANMNVTMINFLFFYTLKTVNGFAYDISDIPPSLFKLTISAQFNQSTKLPSPFPSHITQLEITDTNIIGPLPTFQFGFKLLKLSYLKLNDKWPILPNTTLTIIMIYCNITGAISSLPPNLDKLQIQGNQLIGPLPVFPDSISTITLGDASNEGNSFYDALYLYKPSYLMLGNTNIISIQINDTKSLAICDLSFNPLLNSSNLVNLTMCTQYYLTFQPSPKILEVPNQSILPIVTRVFYQTSVKLTRNSTLSPSTTILSILTDSTTHSISLTLFQIPKFAIHLTWENIIRLLINSTATVRILIASLSLEKSRKKTKLATQLSDFSHFTQEMQ